MSKRRHIKFWRYYKEWIETYKDGQIQDVTYAKYLMIQKQIKNLVPDLYLDEMTRRDVQRLINKYDRIIDAIEALPKTSDEIVDRDLIAEKLSC